MSNLNDKEPKTGFVQKIKANPWYMFASIAGHNMLNWIPDKLYCQLMFRAFMSKKLNLKHPVTFNEKLQWLKLYNHRSEYTVMVDKFAAKQYVGNIVGEQYIIPTYGVWESFNDIDFMSLPDKFVLKCTHDSGGLIICKDKNLLDKEKARTKIEKCLKKNYYYNGREWPYRDVIPRIIAEKYMANEIPEYSIEENKYINSPNSKYKKNFFNPDELTDYKFFCFNGFVDCVMVCIERFSGNTKFYFFDEEWKLLRLNIRGKNAPEDFTLPKPKCINQMFDIVKRLSRGIPFVRIDLYECNGRIYFGEMTFYPQSGFDANLLPETDYRFGCLIDLDHI